MSRNSFFARFAAIIQISVFLFALAPKTSAQEFTDKSALTVFSNTAPITINTASGLIAPTPASLYPSPITVSGMTGTTTKVEVVLRGVTHTSINDLDFLLVSPTGAKFIFLSDGSGGNGIVDHVYTFSDSGATGFGIISGGVYLPTNINNGVDTFPAPATAAPYSSPPTDTFASVFNGANPNGVWNLYAVDDTLFQAGNIVSGWSLNITTNGAPQTFSNSATIPINDMYAQATPYGSVINVSGQTGVVSNLKVTLNGFSHTAPGDVDVLLVSPNGRNLLLMSDISSTSVSNINLTFDDAATSVISTTPISGTYKPTDNTFEFTSGDFFQPPAPIQPYLGNNSALNNFNGYSPNGDWRLFVVDDAQNNAGSISGGWSIDITTAPPTIPPLSCSGPSFSPTSFTAGANPTSLAVADFNNDSNADVAVVNQASNDISILLGNGNGTLGAQASFPAGSAPYSIVAGKFNADNNFDLAVANTNSNNVLILLGNGNGTFSAPTNFPAGLNPISIASADFNNDTKADLAIANFGGFFFGTVTILLGNGTGGFTAGTPVRTRTQPSFVAAANYNGDSNQDLIVTSFGADSVSTFSGVGNGTFLLRQNLTTNAGPVSIEVADFGTDGFLDFAVANYNSDNVRFYTGNSTGDFTSSGSQAVGTNPISVTSGDYTGTGTKTIATALSGGNSVNVLTSNVSVGLFPNAVETADFNNDGKPDIISANSGSNDVSVLLNSCLAAKGNLFDYNGDRRTDYSVFRPSNTNYYIQSLNGGNAFRSFGRSTDTLVPADYNGDRRTDTAYYRPENGLWFVLDEVSRPIYYKQFGLPEDIPAPADFDGDGKADLAVFRPSNGSWYFRRSSDNAEPIVQFGANGDKPVAADFDGDDKADIAVFRPSTGVWYILRSSDSQVFIRQFGIAEDKTVAGDYDGDGKADIAVWRPSSAVWYVLRSTDEGFNAVAWGLPTDFPVVGDFEGDGKFDFAVWRPSDRNWYIRKSSDGGGLIFPWGISTDIPIPNAFVR